MTDHTLEPARTEVIEAMERTAEIYGLNRSYGRLYGILFFTDGALPLDDLVEESGYAKSTVSTAMKQLERLHLVSQQTRPGTGKRVYYEVETDFWNIIQLLLQREGTREVQVMSRALDTADRELEAAPETEETAVYRKRLDELREFYDQLEIVIDLYTRIPVERVIRLAQRFLGGDGGREPPE